MANPDRTTVFFNLYMQQRHWTLEAVQNKKKWPRRQDYYETLINDRIFTLLPRSHADIAEEFEVSPHIVRKDEQKYEK